MKHLSKKKIILFSLIAFFTTITVCVFVRAFQIRKNNETTPLTFIEQKQLESILKQNYKEQYQTLKPLPYKTNPVKLDIGAEAAIAINVSNGNILYEKNADQIIPPASMTKIAVMYVVLKELQNKNISLDSIVPLAPNSWACNMPPHSSLMFLGKNQIVTLEELLLGLSVCSGNDASYAIANFISGNMADFLKKMNEEVQNLGLTKTHFVETSGYSEQNTTTPREMAILCHHYMKEFPEAIKKFHSVLSFSYPKEHNLAPEDKGKPRAQDFTQGIPENITMQIYQKNTNPLLGKLEGCDGLKTGYIEESGYNLALTVVRNDMRILSVTMKGQGNSTYEGQEGRKKDGTTITEWIYNTFAEYKNPLLYRQYKIPLICAKEERVSLVPSYKPEALLIPKVLLNNQESIKDNVKINLVLPKKLRGKITQGTELGYIEYKLNDKLLESIPLVAEKNIKQANPFIYFIDLLAQIVLLI